MSFSSAGFGLPFGNPFQLAAHVAVLVSRLTSPGR